MAKNTTVEVIESTLSDGSLVYDVILAHFSERITFCMVDAAEADKFSGDLLEVIRRNGFLF